MDSNERLDQEDQVNRPFLGVHPCLFVQANRIVPVSHVHQECHLYRGCHSCPEVPLDRVVLPDPSYLVDRVLAFHCVPVAQAFLECQEYQRIRMVPLVQAYLLTPSCLAVRGFHAVLLAHDHRKDQEALVVQADQEGN